MKRIILTIIAATLLTGCGFKTEVPPAHVGKKNTPSGLEEGIIPPSKFRLSWPCIQCDSLILAEVADIPLKEEMTVWMPRDQLRMKVDVRGIVSVSSNAQNVDKIFAKVTAAHIVNDRVTKISTKQIYVVYGRNVIREKVRAVLADYSIAEVMENRDEMNATITKQLREILSASPLTVQRIGLAKVEPPQLIIDARENAKAREVAIQAAEADKNVAIKKAEAALQVAAKQQLVDLKEAETQSLVNQKLAAGVNQAFITQRWLKVMERLASNQDGKVFVLPYEAMQNPAMIMPIVNRALGDEK